MHLLWLCGCQSQEHCPAFHQKLRRNDDGHCKVQLNLPRRQIPECAAAHFSPQDGSALGKDRSQEPLSQLPLISAEKWPLIHGILQTQEPAPASHPGEDEVEGSSCCSPWRCFWLALLPSTPQYALGAAQELLCLSQAGVSSCLQNKGGRIPLNEAAFLS